MPVLLLERTSKGFGNTCTPSSRGQVYLLQCRHVYPLLESTRCLSYSVFGKGEGWGDLIVAITWFA
jgi:hypothetical protein